MSIDIVNFPRRSTDRKRLEAREGKLRCEVSDRWIQFRPESDRFDDIEYLTLDVMTLGTDEKDRKLCELILDKDQLLDILAKLPVNDRTNK
jgi:hypothetical protein